MFTISDDKVVLRDFKESDIEKRICWETTQTEWQLWDAPWEYENQTPEEKEKELQEYIKDMHDMAQKLSNLADTDRRHSFQICTHGGEYIGWCNSYTIDDDYCISDEGTRYTIGIDIPETSQRGNGYAFHALCLFIDYLLAQGEPEIYTQTWSGNTRMISLANKLGFEECRRKPGIRTVRGSIYDGLSFRLDLEKYQAAKSALYC